MRVCFPRRAIAVIGLIAPRHPTLADAAGEEFEIGRRQVNLLATRKREHSRKPDEQYEIIEACSPAPYLELFARGIRKGWVTWGDQADHGYRPTWKTYPHHSAAGRMIAAE